MRSLVLSAAAAVALGMVGTPCSADLILVDFGQSSNQTLEAPVGVTWNNIVGTDDSITDAKTTTGGDTTIDLTISTDFTGPGANGGLTSPSAALLGNIAFSSVTADYLFFTDNLTPQITLSGLDGTSTYNLSFFGTRETAGDRRTTYTVTGGAGALPGLELQTSGTDIGNDGMYDGNDDTILSLAGVAPTVANEIVIDFSATGGFGYLGALQIEVVAIPEPASACVFAGLYGLAFACKRRR